MIGLLRLMHTLSTQEQELNGVYQQAWF